MKRINEYDTLVEGVCTKRIKIELLDDDSETIVEVVSIKEERLSESQSKALSLVLQGNNVFITGGAGNGKSYLIDRIKAKLDEKRCCYYTTATTGSAG